MKAIQLSFTTISLSGHWRSIWDYLISRMGN